MAEWLFVGLLLVQSPEHGWVIVQGWEVVVPGKKECEATVKRLLKTFGETFTVITVCAEIQGSAHIYKRGANT